ncbi:multidrug ABC transporter ATPase [Sulfolobales archaeon HS-7]|nr:multidrug ABC transporter ATPase [Sulfolobales archaeon HS-7]
MSGITVRNLKKIYKQNVEALKGISFTVEYGTIFSLLGPNGAGKTTTVNILSCVTRPTAGEVIVNGLEVPKRCSKIRGQIGVVPQKFVGFADLTVEENIEYFVKLYSGRNNQTEQLISLFSLEDYRRVKFRRLSGGYQRRVAIACALAGNPSIIFMDEPSVGLDPQTRRDLWNYIREVKKEGRIVFMTTHYMEEAENLSDNIAILFQGKIIAVGKPSEITTGLKKGNLEDAYLSLLDSLKSSGD